MEKRDESSAPGLKRSLGLLDTVSIEVGAIIGAGIFALTGMAVARCGPAVPFAFLIAAIPMVLALLPIGMLASVLPTVGGSFRYPSRILSPFWGFIGVWGIMMGIMLGGMPMYALNFADYLRVIFPAFDRNLIAVAALTFFFVINVVGVKTASAIQVGMFFVLIAALLVYIVWGIPAIDTANLTPLFGSGFAGLGIAAAMLFFAYMGANFIIDLGAEIKDAGRNIPRSFAISMPIVIVIYTLMGLVTVGTVPLSQCANQPLSGARRAIHAAGAGALLHGGGRAAGAGHHYQRHLHVRLSLHNGLRRGRGLPAGAGRRKPALRHPALGPADHVRPVNSLPATGRIILRGAGLHGVHRLHHPLLPHPHLRHALPQEDA